MTLDPEKIRKRVARISTDDLFLWADNAAAGMMRQLDDFRRNPDESHLAEVKLASLTMDLVCDELGVRLKQAQEQLDSDNDGS